MCVSVYILVLYNSNIVTIASTVYMHILHICFHMQAHTYNEAGYHGLAQRFGRLSCTCTVIAMALTLVLILLVACVLLLLYMVNGSLWFCTSFSKLVVLLHNGLQNHHVIITRIVLFGFNLAPSFYACYIYMMYVNW